MAKITITLMDLPDGKAIAVAVQSENPEKEETPAARCAGDILAFMCERVQGLEEQMIKSNEGAMH